MLWIRQGLGFKGSGFRVNQLTLPGFGEIRACRVQSLRPTWFGEEGLVNSLSYSARTPESSTLKLYKVFAEGSTTATRSPKRPELRERRKNAYAEPR